MFKIIHKAVKVTLAAIIVVGVISLGVSRGRVMEKENHGIEKLISDAIAGTENLWRKGNNLLENGEYRSAEQTYSYAAIWFENKKREVSNLYNFLYGHKLIDVSSDTLDDLKYLSLGEREASFAARKMGEATVVFRMGKIENAKNFQDEARKHYQAARDYFENARQ